MKRLFEYYLQNIPHKGKRHAVRWALKVLPFNSLASHYGPVMKVNRQDKTNIYALCGEYGHVISNHVKKIQAGEVFIDIGTNYGLFSLMASRQVGPQGFVFSFEPNPAIYGDFLANINYNECRNIIPFHCAVSDKSQLMGLSFEKGHSGKSHLSESGFFTVPTFNPAEWVFLANKIGDKNVHVKIDVEGYEAGILKIISAAPWFKNVKSIVVEIDDENLKSFGSSAKEGIYTPLENAGFRPTINGKSGTHYDEIFVR